MVSFTFRPVCPGSYNPKYLFNRRLRGTQIPSSEKTMELGRIQNRMHVYRTLDHDVGHPDTSVGSYFSIYDKETNKNLTDDTQSYSKYQENNVLTPHKCYVACPHFKFLKQLTYFHPMQNACDTVPLEATQIS